MENHPIPQDITGFQFKLIGEMTVKQFAYLAAGVVSAWFFIFIAPLPFLIKFPIGLFCAAAGAGFAFVPIEGRPMDTMVMYFFNSLVKPNQYIFQKQGGRLDILFTTSVASPRTQKQLASSQSAPRYTEADVNAFLQTIPQAPKNELDQKELAFFQNLSTFAGTTTYQPPAPRQQRQQAKPQQVPSVPKAQPQPAPQIQQKSQPVAVPTAQTASSLTLSPAPKILSAITDQAQLQNTTTPVINKQPDITIPEPTQTVEIIKDAPRSNTITYTGPRILEQTQEQVQPTQQKGTPVMAKPVISGQAKEPDQKDLDKIAEEQKQALEIAKQEEAQKQNTALSQEAHQKVLAMESQLQETMLSKKKLEEELLALKKQLAEQQQTKPQVFSPSVKEAPQQSANVQAVPQQMAKPSGLPVPEAANLVTGMVRDPRGNPLPNILIEIHDKQGNPVRAFKTNQLGQFKSATALTNGEYTLQFEDTEGKHRFDTVQLITKGEVVMPLEVTSVDDREELRRWLFNDKAQQNQGGKTA